ncbi:MAG TPA: metallopeptidase TldD-related protein [Candidatus Acidoferrales bacterium]|nr:metallopeptidase TldD-related protein [Candidatus Acidoferrales bacterium]
MFLSSKKKSSLHSVDSITIRGAIVLGILAFAAPWTASPADDPHAEAMLNVMQQELARAQSALAKSQPAPYFIGYTVYDQQVLAISAGQGSVMSSVSSQRRVADVTMRVGTPALDNTHGQGRQSGIMTQTLPLGDDKDALTRGLWLLTNQEYRQAVPAFLNIKTATAVQSEEEDKSPDFSTEAPHKDIETPGPPVALKQKEWEDRARLYSAAFTKYPFVYNSIVSLDFEQNTQYMITSDGTRLVEPGHLARLIIEAETRADDGMELFRVETFQAATPDELPAQSVIEAKAEKMAADLKALRAAPVNDPFDGPAMLSGRAAAVFFHEVLGHRLEGHRQRGEEEGQTFTKKVNEQVLPKFLTVVDDPTMHELNGVKLAGYYAYDDEGVPAQRVDVIDDGVLKNFLMSRIPVKNFSQSNGHGRRQPGAMATGRQGNLIVISKNSVADSDLRQKFIDEIKRQNKPYGLYFEDVEGGFTLTTRQAPQAFQVLPVIVWRVFPDGKPDQLVRGVDIVGTPLAALERIMLTGTKTEVFNGVCGAESGNVPVSAAAPAMLFSEMEVQKSAHSHDRPPILPPPGSDSAASPAAKSGAGGSR